MNYLAHLVLAGDTAASRIGQLLGDFVPGRPEVLRQTLPAEVVDAIVQHRQIDQWTDRHPLVREAQQWIAPERGRFRGVIVDILFDHFLVLEWSRFHAMPLRQFLDRFYQELQHHRDWLPAGLASDLDDRIARDWLGHYGTDDGLAGVFLRTSQRNPKFAPIAAALSDLIDHRAAFHRSFLEFFPSLMRIPFGSGDD